MKFEHVHTNTHKKHAHKNSDVSGSYCLVRTLLCCIFSSPYPAGLLDFLFSHFQLTIMSSAFTASWEAISKWRRCGLWCVPLCSLCAGVFLLFPSTPAIHLTIKLVIYLPEYLLHSSLVGEIQTTCCNSVFIFYFGFQTGLFLFILIRSNLPPLCCSPGNCRILLTCVVNESRLSQFNERKLHRHRYLYTGWFPCRQYYGLNTNNTRHCFPSDKDVVHVKVDFKQALKVMVVH